MSQKIDLVGQRFGRLVVVEKTNIRSSNGEISWECLCDCGNKHSVFTSNIRQGNVKSCGCLRKEKAAKKIKSKKMVENHEKFLQNDTVEIGTRISTLTHGLRSDNISGIRGVSWRKSDGTWLASLTIKGVRVLNTRFKNKQDAINARKEAEEKYFKPILEKYDK